MVGIIQCACRCLRSAVAAIASLVLCGVCAHAQAGFTFRHEPRALGSADILGYAIWTAPLGSIQLNGNEIPLRLDFTSDPRPQPTTSPLGRGWSIPFFSSALVEENQTTMRWHRPDGRIFYFSRERGNQDGKPAKPNDPVEFVSTEASWKAVKDPRKRFVVISHVTNGTELFYEDGRLVRFRFGESAASAGVYLISYNRLGRPQRLSALSTGRALVEFSYETADRAKSLTIGDKTIALKFADAALNQFPEGPYLSEVGDGSLQPLAITYQADGRDINRVRFERMSNGGGSTGLAWQAKSGFIIEDDGASYKIENPSLANAGRLLNDSQKPSTTSGGVVPYNWRPEEAKVTRVDREGKSEYRYFDRAKGVSTSRDRDGVTTIVYSIRAQGALANKVRKIEEIRNGKTVVLERNAYDELGRQVRKIDSSGVVSIWEYLDGGNHVKMIKNGSLVSETYYRSGQRVLVKDYSNGEVKETAWVKSAESEEVVTRVDGVLQRRILTQFDSQGRKKRYEQSSPPYTVDYEYSPDFRTERISRNAVYWATEYYDKEGGKVKTEYATGDIGYWVKAGPKALLIHMGSSGEVKSVSEIMDNVYRSSTGEEIEISKIIARFTTEHPWLSQKINNIIAVK